MQDLATVRGAFTHPREFWSSPLYRALSAVVAEDASLVALAAHARPGQGPTFAFFGAVHALLLDGADHDLAEYYPSLRGAAARPPDAAADAALVDFATHRAAEIRQLLQTRLVQTNHAQRAVGLRLGLSTIADDVGRRPAHVLEVGCSAGLVLRHAAYGYRLGDRQFGDRHAAVQLRTGWRSRTPVPDLDALPVIASHTGVDLNPLDPGDAADRRWLRALVWPENLAQARLLDAALLLATRTPVTVLAGDAVDRAPEWGAGLPDGDVRVVFHCATRMHVPTDRLPAFDAAIDGLADTGPLYRIAVEGDGLAIRGPDGVTRTTFDVDGHLAWARPA